MKSVQQIIRDVDAHWVGDGFPVRSMFSYADGNRFDPYLLLDYAGPHIFAPTQAQQGVGEHPHRGFETVTIVYQGELEHRDSSGSHGTIGAGDVQWMTAASGVVHEEFHSHRFAESGGTLEMVQLWVNLPAQYKLSPPRYQSILAKQIPQLSLEDGAGSVRVVAGKFRHLIGPAQTFSPIQVWDVQLNQSHSITLDCTEGHTACILVLSGSAEINRAGLERAELALLNRSGTQFHLAAKSVCRLLVLIGEPLSEPIAGQGPFVMNTRDEIRQAIRDYQMGLMGTLAAK